MRLFSHVLMSRHLIQALQSSISLLMRVFTCIFFFFAVGKKDEITQVCVQLLYSLNIQH